MKKVFGIVAISVFSLLIISSCGKKNYGSAKIKTKDDSVSYFLGLTYGSGIKQAKIDSLFNYDAFMKGVNEAVAKDSMPVSQMEIQSFLNKFFSDLQSEQVKKEYKGNMDANKAFLEANSKKDSVVTLPSGLQYIVLKEGKGKKPTMNDKIRVHYTGKLIDGTIFDSSYNRKEPAEFIVGQVIPGWVEALQLMSEGAKWRIFIPEGLAYGAQPPRGSNIKPFSTLIFDVELLQVIPAPDNAQMGK
jgi:FKBP-type peptidyl-prolyl cis-trans isomerase FklB